MQTHRPVPAPTPLLPPSLPSGTSLPACPRRQTLLAFSEAALVPLPPGCSRGSTASCYDEHDPVAAVIQQTQSKFTAACGGGVGAVLLPLEGTQLPSIMDASCPSSPQDGERESERAQVLTSFMHITSTHFDGQVCLSRLQGGQEG